MDKEKQMEEFARSIKGIVEYWSSLPDKTDYEKCDGVAFSILNVLDGNKFGTPPHSVRPIDEEGNEGEDIAGHLHEVYSQL